MLKVKTVGKFWQDGPRTKTILTDISHEFLPGQTTAIVGPSGSGKSTFLQIISGLTAPDQGKVLYQNKNLYTALEQELITLRQHEFGFVMQNHYLLPELNVLENISLPAVIAGNSFKQARLKAHKLLQQFSLEYLTHQTVHNLSGGEKQRVAFLRSVCNAPKILFADEPTGSLDEQTAADLIDFIGNLAQQNNMIAIIVTHDLYLAAKLDFVYKIDQGRLTPYES